MSDAEERTSRSAAGRAISPASQFNDLIAPLVKRTLMACRRALRTLALKRKCWKW
ncbi:hypothetical protein MJ575_21880 [Klebsiella pneumoniae]|nr:hypothetical protein MJ575_21880 [Klebsiella pneumoniae]